MSNMSGTLYILQGFSRWRVETQIWKQKYLNVVPGNSSFSPTTTHVSSNLGSNRQCFTSDKSGEACVFWAPQCDIDFDRPARAAQSFCRKIPQTITENISVLTVKYLRKQSFSQQKWRYSHYSYLLLWQFGQWTAKCNHRQEGSDHYGFDCQRGKRGYNL